MDRNSPHVASSASASPASVFRLGLWLFHGVFIDRLRGHGGPMIPQVKGAFYFFAVSSITVKNQNRERRNHESKLTVFLCFAAFELPSTTRCFEPTYAPSGSGSLNVSRLNWATSASLQTQMKVVSYISCSSNRRDRYEGPRAVRLEL
jgi:hypothetical protein